MSLFAEERAHRCKLQTILIVAVLNFSNHSANKRVKLVPALQRDSSLILNMYDLNSHVNPTGSKFKFAAGGPTARPGTVLTR